MVPILPAIIGAIPSIIKLFDSDDREQGVKELTGQAISEAQKLFGVNFNSTDELLQHLNANPDEVVRLKQLESKTQLKMQELGIIELQEDTKRIESVNETIQQETKSEHWVSYSWRPFIGFSFGLYLNSLWLLPVWNKIPTTMSVDMILTIGAILGVASWHRGVKQIKEAEKGK